MSAFKKVVFFWPVLLAILAVTAAAGVLQYRVGAVESKASETACEVAEINTRVARMEEAIGQLPEMRSDIKELLRRSK